MRAEPDDPLDTDIVLDPQDPGFAQTGLQARSTIRTHIDGGSAVTRRLLLDRAISLRVSASAFPRVRITTQMQHREHRNQVRFRREEHPVRKIANQGAPNVFLNDWELKRISRTLAKTVSTCA